MIKKFYFIFCLFLCGYVGAQNSSFKISGSVVDSRDQTPIPGVYVTAGPAGAQTDKDGKFLIEGLQKGEYILKTVYFFDYSTDVKTVNLTQNIEDLTFNIQQETLGLDEVVITGTRTEKKLADVPVQTTLIRGRDIERSVTTSLMEALEYNVPGIVTSPNAMGNNMRIKGLNSRYILFLVDGERLVSEGAGGNINLDQIDVNNIERIEIIEGASSALYGSNAVGAVINVITKNPASKLEGTATVSLESHKTLQSRLDLGTALKKVSLRVSGFRNSSDGFGADGSGPYAAKYADYGSEVKLKYKPVERIDLNASFRYFQHETFNPENSMNVVHPFTQTLAGGANTSFTSLNKKNNLRLSVNYDKYFDYDILEKKDDEKRKDNTAGYLSARVVNTYSVSDKLEFVGGLEFNDEEIFSSSSLGSEPTTKRVNDQNFFAQGHYKATESLDFVLGARYTHNSQFGSAFNPKFSFMFSSPDGFRFRAGVGSAFRAPSIKELYYDFDHQGSFWVYGNPDLKPEKGFNVSLSFEYTYEALSLSLSAYHNDVSEKITQYDVINSLGALEKYYKNVSSATLSGFDFSVAYTFLKQFVLKGNYSYCDAVDNSTGFQLSSNVRYSGTASFTWNARFENFPFSLQMAGRFNSPKIYQSIEVDSEGNNYIEFNNSKSYAIWKAVFVKPIRIKKSTLELTLKADNLFNFKDVSFINPGRQYLVGLRYKFNK